MSARLSCSESELALIPSTVGSGDPGRLELEFSGSLTGQINYSHSILKQFLDICFREVLLSNLFINYIELYGGVGDDIIEKP